MGQPAALLRPSDGMGGGASRRVASGEDETNEAARQQKEAAAAAAATAAAEEAAAAAAAAAVAATEAAAAEDEAAMQVVDAAPDPADLEREWAGQRMKRKARRSPSPLPAPPCAPRGYCTDDGTCCFSARR